MTETRIFTLVNATTRAYLQPSTPPNAHKYTGKRHILTFISKGAFNLLKIMCLLPACFTAAGESVRGEFRLIIDSATRYFWNFEERTENKNRPFTPTEKRIRSAAAEAVELLKSGAWIPADDVREIAKKHRCGFDAICQEAKIAESDDGHFVCIPTDKTPAEPDGGSK